MAGGTSVGAGPIPVDGAAQAFFEVDGGLKAQQLARSGDIGLRVQDVARAFGGVYRRQIAAQDLVQLRDQIIQRDASAGGQVDGLADGQRGPRKPASCPARHCRCT